MGFDLSLFGLGFSLLWREVVCPLFRSGLPFSLFHAELAFRLFGPALFLPFSAVALPFLLLFCSNNGGSNIGSSGASGRCH